jgi:hypothetical protein
VKVTKPGQPSCRRCPGNRAAKYHSSMRAGRNMLISAFPSRGGPGQVAVYDHRDGPVLPLRQPSTAAPLGTTTQGTNMWGAEGTLAASRSL